MIPQEGLKAVYEQRQAQAVKRTEEDRQAQKLASGLRARRRRLTRGGNYRV